MEETDQLRALLEPGRTFVDGGAHVGSMTLLGARAVGPEGRVIAIEVSPANAALLRANVAANGLVNVDVVTATASGRSGTLTSSAPSSSGLPGSPTGFRSDLHPVPGTDRCAIVGLGGWCESGGLDGRA